MPKEISILQYEDVRKQIGHYRKMDYHPEIRPAGTVLLTEGIEDCFKDYKLEDGVEALKSTLLNPDKRNENQATNYSSKISNVKSGLDNGVKSCLEMNKRTPFQTLIAELRDTSMKSYWKKEVGKIPDQTPNLPDGMDPVLTIFGKRTKSNGTAAELVNPPKSAAKVIQDSRIGHALYKMTHNDYYPSEQVDRKYGEPFNKNHRYGKKINIDKLGGKAKRSLTWFDQNVASIVSNRQADFLDDTQNRLGRAVIKADIAPLLEDRTFGKVNERGTYGVGELLKNNSSPNSDKSIQKLYLEHFNRLRLNLKKRALSFADLYQTFVYYDKDKTQTTTLEETCRILANFDIHPDEELFKFLLIALNLIRDNRVPYKDVTDLLNWKCEFPLLPKIEDGQFELSNYQSTYKNTICGASLPKENPSYTAGLRTERVDLPYTVVPPGGPRCDRENLGDQTSVAAILSPSIFTQYGLSHLDFFKIRKPHEIRKLFGDMGLDFPGDSFNVIWNEGLKKDCTGGVCIETFRAHLDRIAAAAYEQIPVT